VAKILLAIPTCAYMQESAKFDWLFLILLSPLCAMIYFVFLHHGYNHISCAFHMDRSDMDRSSRLMQNKSLLISWHRLFFKCFFRYSIFYSWGIDMKYIIKFFANKNIWYFKCRINWNLIVKSIKML